MASASTKKLETLLECPICIEKVTNPRLFECLHFYCQPCVGDMKPKTDGKVTGYECPTCRRITPKDKLRAMHFIHELLEVVEMAKQEQARVCEICKEAPAEHKCHDCKQVFCSNCKNQHNRIAILQNHRWESLDESARAVLDKHVHCAKHPQELVKVHCKDCKMLICLICNGTDHKQHTAETVDEALEHTLTTVKKNQEEIKQVIGQNEDILAKARADMTKVEKQYDEIEREIERKQEEIIRKAREDSKQLKGQLAKTKSIHIEEIQQFIKTTDLTLKGQTNILSLSTTTLATAQSTSLLQALQSGVIQSLSSNINDSPIVPKYQQDVDINFAAAQAQHENMVGSIVKKECVIIQPHPLFNNRSLSEATKKTTTMIKETALTFTCTKFAKINEEFYCVDFRSSKIHVYGEGLNKIREFTLQGTGKVRSVAQVGPFLLIASEKGLYYSSMDGSNVRNIINGSMTSICWMGDVGYVLDDTNSRVIVISFNKSTQTFAQQKELKLDPYDKDWGNALQVTREFIWIAFPGKNVIRKYDHDGMLLSSHDASDSAIEKLNFPWLCGQDAEGCLLIADCHNRRLVTLSPGGEWQRLQLDGLQNPLCAMVDNNNLFVTQWSPKQFMKYAFD